MKFIRKKTPYWIRHFEFLNETKYFF